MGYIHLTPEERGQIEAYLDEGLSKAEIGRRLGRHKSTISREIRRGTETRKRESLALLRYQASSAQFLAGRRKSNCGTATKATIHNVKTILKYLEQKFSPEQIAFSVKSVKVSTQTIYRWIHDGTIPFDIKRLRRKGKGYRPKVKKKRMPRVDPEFFKDRLITDRPESVQLRTEFGHWEADTVLSKQGVGQCLATFVERKTRHYVAIKIANRTARSMMLAIKTLLERYPGGVKSLTCDRGREFVSQYNVGTIEDTFGCKIYFANPYASHERGSNENHNGLIREFFPKPFSFKSVNQQTIKEATDNINNRPRKILNWKSANHRFNIEYARAVKANF